MRLQRRILIGCLGVPEFGGESAVASALHAQLHSEGVEAYLLNLVEPSDVCYCQHMLGTFGNPHGLPDIETLHLESPILSPRPEIANAIEMRAPNLLIGVGSAAAVMLKRAAPGLRTFFISTASHHLHLKRPRRYYRKPRWPALVPDLDVEDAAVAAADLVVAHSPSAHASLAAHFPTYEGKLADDIFWLGDWVRQDVDRYGASKRAFEEREVDVLFVARSWKEERSNRELMVQLAERCRDLRVQIVGDGGECGIGTFWPEAASRKELLRLMGNAKVVILPGLRASAPFVFYEAAAMGCNLVTSIGCGNWQFANADLIATPGDLDSFIEKIQLALARPLACNLDGLAASSPYELLVEMAAVL